VVKRLRRGAGVAVVMAAAAASGCAPPPPGGTVPETWRIELASVDAAGGNSGNNRSEDGRVSADGTKVVFQSFADDLVPNDTNGGWDVFVRDLTTGVTSLVSVNQAGTSAGAIRPVISPDGTKVAFDSNSTDLAPGDADTSLDVYVRDLTTGVTTLVATTAAGGVGPGASIAGVFSPDGTRLTYGATVSPTDLRINVYVRDLVTGEQEMVSVDAAGTGPGDAWSLDTGTFSPDGRRLAFVSQAGNLVPNDRNGENDLFVRDLDAGVTTLVSVNAAGTGPGNTWTTDHGVFSPDGTKLAFASRASDLVPVDTNGVTDVFLRDLTRATTTLVSVNASGTDSARGLPSDSSESTTPAFSPDGRKVAFGSYASDFGPVDTDPNIDVYLRDLTAGTTTLVSTNGDGTDSAGAGSYWPEFAGQGSTLLFESRGNLGPPDTNGASDVYVADLSTGTVTLVSANADGTNGGNDYSHDASISRDGRTIVFESFASDLGPTDTNDGDSRMDVYVATLGTGA
jgi:Tol biopolymer transport system component